MNKGILVAVLLTGLLLLIPALAQPTDTVTVTIADTTGRPGDTLDLPIIVDTLTGLGITDVAIVLTYDEAILTALSVTVTGTIAEGCWMFVPNIGPGNVRAAIVDTGALSGAGPLVFVKFVVDPTASPGVVSPLHFDEVSFNEGAIPSNPQDGSFSIPPVHVSIPDTTGVPCDTILIPVIVDDDITGLGVTDVAIELTYAESILTALDATVTGTIAEGCWMFTFNVVGPGSLRIAIVDSIPLSGSGPLVWVKFHVDTTAHDGDTTSIHFTQMTFNEVAGSAITDDGWFEVMASFAIIGNIRYYSSDSIANVVVTAFSAGLPVRIDTTDINGNYGLMNLPGANYVVSPTKEGDVGSAITPHDAAIALRYWVGLDTLNPYQKIAADVSGNCDVTPHDAALILQYWVGLIDSFPVGKDWTFVPTSFAIDHTNWCNAPDSAAYTPLNSNIIEDYFGIVYGDPSGNWSPGGKAAIIKSKVGK